MVEDKNNTIKEAREEYEYLTGDEALQRIAFLKRKYELDHNNAMHHAKKEAEERGIKLGEKYQKEEIAKKLLAKKMKIEEIVEITGLTREEIESLKWKFGNDMIYIDVNKRGV